MVRRILLAGLVAGAATAAGCKHCCKRDGRAPLPPAPPGGFLSAPAAPRGDTYIPPPPGGLPSSPGPGLSAPPPGDGSLPPPTLPDTSRSFRPDATAPGGPKLLLPDPLPGGTSSAAPSNKMLGDPVHPAGGADLPPRSGSSAPTRTAGVGGVFPAGHAEPAGTPEFAVVKPGLATGRKPGVDGFAALRAAGYKTAVYLHTPGEDLTATKALTEASGLRFEAVPVGPETVSAAYEQFRVLATDPAARPLFAFDATGARAGGMWYLLFRDLDGLSDDAARVRSAPLGLRDSSADGAAIWAAVKAHAARR